MTNPFDPLQILGPAPYQFTPSPARLSGPAFSMAFKALTVLMVGAVGIWLILLWWQGKFGDTGKLASVQMAGWFVLGWLLMVWTAWHVLKSLTTLDSTGLHQSWIWDKHLPLDELAYGKLIRVRGLEWLMAPRLYVRTLMGKFAVFYAADPHMLAEFERLVNELKAFRQD
jgi:hypothetical protein